MANNEYKKDFHGVMLMRKVFPKQINEQAVEKLAISKPDIHAFARKFFTKNQIFFGKRGVALEDLESIFTCQSYVLFSNRQNERAVLFNFLKQRGLKILDQYRNFPDFINESSLDDNASLEELAMDPSDPEQITIANEEAEILLMDIRSGLIDGSKTYTQDFYEKHSSILRKNDIGPETLSGIVLSSALKYAEKQYVNKSEINVKEFRALLVTEMSKLLNSLRNS